MITLRQFASLMTLGMLLAVLGCTESSRTDSEKSEQPGFTATEQPGFTATVSGVVKGNLSGQGIVTYIAPQDTVSGKRPGYYLVSNIIHDALVAKDWVVTFRVPDGTHSGTYQLVSADPRNVGEEFEARLEGMVDKQPVSFRSNTEGSLTLDSFPSHSGQLSGSTIKGTFQFNVENSHGEVAEVNGAFNFPVRA